MGPSAPFYHANRTLYRWARLTGGIFGPIRPQYPDGHSSCPANINACADSTNPSLRVVNGQYLRYSDPQCRTTGQQITAYMDEIMSTNPYLIVRVP